MPRQRVVLREHLANPMNHGYYRLLLPRAGMRDMSDPRGSMFATICEEGQTCGNGEGTGTDPPRMP